MSDTGRYPERADVVIVGSGPTGAACARILTERAPGASIVVLEAGHTVSDPPGAHVKNITDREQRALAQRRSVGPGAGAPTFDSPGDVTANETTRRARPGTSLLADGFRESGDGLPLAATSTNVGGMAAHWTGACPRPGGGERIPFVDDLDELLGEAERLLGVTTDAFDDVPLAERVRGLLSRAVDEGRAPHQRVQRMPLAVHRRGDGRLVWSGSDVVLGAVTRANPAFTLHDESRVVRILVTGGRAHGVRVRDGRTGQLHDIAAGTVVVAADALRTPQLLWASGVRPAALGRRLNDQPQVVFAARMRDVSPPYPTTRAAAGALAEQSGVSWVPYTDEVPFHGQIMQLDTSPVPLAADDPAAPGSIVGLGLFLAKELQDDDRVAFDDTTPDADGLPALRIHYALTATDHARIDRAKQEIRRLAEAVGEPLGPAPVVLPPGASLHYQGTVAMGPADDGTSVCDVDGRVWGVAGLVVAGNGVIPTATACNPTLTSVALAVRAARRIASDLTASPTEGVPVPDVLTRSHG
jgi:choline dehydrogenase-like flavoprotein